ncbi:MAG: hypothetical protein M0R32_05870 [Candidatus Cloacimonetes bacterium]|nr:hypothetical protein [Candidatus Cloacimonadota bacterium]
MNDFILQADFSHHSQSWFYTHIEILGPNKYRVRIRRNAYDFQCYAIVEIWTGKKWSQVISRPIEEMSCNSVSYTQETLSEADKTRFKVDATNLLALAVRIAG